MPIVSTITIKPGKLDPFSQDVLRELSKRVAIGIPGDAPPRTAEPGEPEPPSNAVIGYLMETGAPDRHLPARPFLVPGVESIREEATALLAKGAAAAFSGNPSVPEKVLHTIGLNGVSAVRAQITDGAFAPLSERTLTARRARGVTRTNPLVDKGELKNSVGYVILPGNIPGR